MSADDTIAELQQATDLTWGPRQFRALASGAQYRHLYELMKQYVPQGAHVLDWGAGNGHFSYFLQRAGYHATGFSFEGNGFVKTLPDAANYAFVAGDPSEPVRLPFDDDTFDAVGSIGVLEHVRETGGDEAASLRELLRVTKPGGHFVRYHLPRTLSWIEGAAALVPKAHHHAYRYGSREAVGMIKRAGFDLVDYARYGLIPRNLFGALPAPLRRSRKLASWVNAVDEAAMKVAWPVSQNQYLVARKPVARPNAGQHAG